MSYIVQLELTVVMVQLSAQQYLMDIKHWLHNRHQQSVTLDSMYIITNAQFAQPVITAKVGTLHLP